MPVTKQVYTAAATWTAPQLANVFRSAFIDAGLMTEWFDSSTNSGIENRVLEITYAVGKTFGKTYYWFQFFVNGPYSYTGFHLCTSTQWNTTTKAPAGTALLDYVQNNNNIGYSGDPGGYYGGGPSYSFFPVAGLSTTTSFNLVRYTSQADTSVSWFLGYQGNTYAVPFMIAPPSHGIASWIDLDKNQFSHFIRPNLFLSAGSANLTFYATMSAYRRMWCMGSSLLGNEFLRTSTSVATSSYSVHGRVSNSVGNNSSNTLWWDSAIPTHLTTVLPSASSASNANPAYSSNYNPICSGVRYSNYMPSGNLPSDFAIIPHYADNTLQPFDKFVVSSGVEEWEIMSRVNSGAATTNPSLAFAARVI